MITEDDGIAKSLVVETPWELVTVFLPVRSGHLETIIWPFQKAWRKKILKTKPYWLDHNQTFNVEAIWWRTQAEYLLLKLKGELNV